MRYLIGHYDPELDEHPSGRLKAELLSLNAIRSNPYTCTVESNLGAEPLAAHLKRFLDPGEWFLLVDIADRATLREERDAEP